MVVPDSWREIDEDPLFKSNVKKSIDDSMIIWSWDAHVDMLAAIVGYEGKKRQCLVFDGDGRHQYTIPNGGTKVRLSPDAIFLYGRDEGELVRVNRRTGEEDSFSFPHGVNNFEVDLNGRIWFLYGGYDERDSCVIYDCGAELKLGSLSLDQLSTALTRKNETKVAPPQEEGQLFYRFAEMSRAFDGYTAVYDPKQDALFDSITRTKIAIDHHPDPSDNIISLRDWIVLFKGTNVPHDNSSFGTFCVYTKEPGWNEYSANVREVFYTTKFEDVIFSDIRVMDRDSFV
ncbi:hypothetical protein HYU22_02050 [Candidatus Woesearchaeota archaeon]|nr:hypothetical protein [Candidatus Woesearchaeota archaeon]